MRPMHVAHPQINCKVTKCPNVVLTWVHTNNGTIPPLKVRGPTWTSASGSDVYVRIVEEFAHYSRFILSCC